MSRHDSASCVSTSKEPLLNNEAVFAQTHYKPQSIRDKFAFIFCKMFRAIADSIFGARHGHRALFLEAVAAVPGMVAAFFLHLKCLRRRIEDHGWIMNLIHEAANERMHLMALTYVTQPLWWEKILIYVAQWFFVPFYTLLYLFSLKTAHRMVGYFEEEAVRSYTKYLEAIDEGVMANPQAPKIAIVYWKLSSDACLRDMIEAIRIDESSHRDANHFVASHNYIAE